MLGPTVARSPVIAKRVLLELTYWASLTVVVLPWLVEREALPSDHDKTCGGGAVRAPEMPARISIVVPAANLPLTLKSKDVIPVLEFPEDVALTVTLPIITVRTPGLLEVVWILPVNPPPLTWNSSPSVKVACARLGAARMAAPVMKTAIRERNLRKRNIGTISSEKE